MVIYLKYSKIFMKRLTIFVLSAIGPTRLAIRGEPVLMERVRSVAVNYSYYLYY